MVIETAEDAREWFESWGPRGPGRGYLESAISGQRGCESLTRDRWGGETDRSRGHREAAEFLEGKMREREKRS